MKEACLNSLTEISIQGPLLGTKEKKNTLFNYYEHTCTSKFCFLIL